MFPPDSTLHAGNGVEFFLRYHMIIMGADPGVSGAIAFLDTQAPQQIQVYDTPSVNKELDTATLTRLIKVHTPDLCILERVHAMPKQGVVSVWNFGMAYGMLRGVLGALHVPYQLVTPASWKRHYRLDADKEAARWMAISIWPACPDFSRKKDHGRAEAALMAKYGADTDHH